jgi:hypothetical protein
MTGTEITSDGGPTDTCGMREEPWSYGLQPLRTSGCRVLVRVNGQLDHRWSQCLLVPSELCCAKGDAFVVKVYPDGFMSVTRS